MHREVAQLTSHQLIETGDLGSHKVSILHIIIALSLSIIWINHPDKPRWSPTASIVFRLVKVVFDRLQARVVDDETRSRSRYIISDR